MSAEEKKEILKMIEEGKITAEEAIELIKAIEADEAQNEADAFSAEAPFGAQASEDDTSDTASQTQEKERNADFNAIADKVRGFWRIPLWIGIGITVLGGLWMLGAMRSAGFGFWFYCSWLPLLLGVFIITLVVGSRKSHWLFVKVKQSPGEKPENITFGFPLPLRLSAWILRTFGGMIPGMENVVGVEEILETLADTPVGDSALIVDVKDDDGEEVQVFIG